MTGTMTIVCFAAHPDDLEFSCTGTLSILKDQGYRIIYVIVTNGENGFKEDDKLTPEKRVAIRNRWLWAGNWGLKKSFFWDTGMDSLPIMMNCVRNWWR